MLQTEQAGELLRSLGLNNLEADVYVFLLQSGEPVTAYRIGKALRRPTANVYKAIDALARKGAVVVDQEPRVAAVRHHPRNSSGNSNAACWTKQDMR